MHLADYEESLVNRRIWTQRDQIEERLAELSEHIEKVIQMYLRNEYATITEYNEKAGSVAEKYNFLVIADFPANFSEIAVKRLQSIAQSARAAVFSLSFTGTSASPPRRALSPTNCAKAASAFAKSARNGSSTNSKPNWESPSPSILRPPANSPSNSPTK